VYLVGPGVDDHVGVLGPRLIVARTGESRETVVSERNTVVRSLHDLGLAAWFGGSLAVAVGFNGAAADVPDEKLRLRVPMRPGPAGPRSAWSVLRRTSSLGPGSCTRTRTGSPRVGTSTIAKAALTGAALAMTGYSRVLGKKLEKAGGEPVEGGSDPSPVTSPDVAKVQRQLKVCQCSCRG
jgi:hypothetical protein